MSLRRFKVDLPLDPGPVFLEGEEGRHLRVVLRARAGERITVFDGAGHEAEAEVLDAGRDRVSCRVAGPVRVVPKPACTIELVCALPRAGAADDVVRVAVEVGATAIRPLIAERGVWRPEGGEVAASKGFVRASVAALKQSGRSWMPDLLPAVDAAGLPIAAGELAILGSVGEGSVPVRDVLSRRHPTPRTVVIVGPEGGLTAREEEILVSKGAIRVHAGRAILRVETAVIVLVSHVTGACA